MTTTRKGLMEARMRRGWSQEDLAAKIGVRRETVSQWERGAASPYPAHIQALCELYGMTTEELGLHNYDTTNLLVNTACIGGIIEQCAAGIDVCRRLSYDDISSDNMTAAAQIIATYIPILQSLQSLGRTASLLAQAFQIRRGNAYHLESTAHARIYGEEAVRYARITENPAILATTLHELASVYEWPLPGLQLHWRHRKSLELVEEAVRVQETKHGVPLQIQAWNYIGQAKFRALNGLKQDAYASIGRANEVQSHMTSPDTIQFCVFKDGTTSHMTTNVFSSVNLVRQAAIAYSYLNEQSKAVSTFLEAVDINDEQIRPVIPMSDRLHISLLSEVLYSTLRLPSAKKDKDLSVKLWKASLAKALTLRSATYISEAQRNLDTMECVWPDEAEVADLRDLLISSYD